MTFASRPGLRAVVTHVCTAVLLALTLIGVSAGVASAEPGGAALEPDGVLVQPIAADVSNLGSSVALSADGSTAVVGAPSYATAAGDQIGEALVYTRTGSAWQPQAILGASDATAGDYFGWSVALSSDGDTAFVGAVGHDGFRGAIFVFHRSGSSWKQSSELTAADGVEGAELGYSISPTDDGSEVLAGSSGYNSGTGRAYVFADTGGTWSQVAELRAGRQLYRTNFGAAVALSPDGSSALVGAPGFHGGSGAVYAFEPSAAGRTGWAQTQKYTPPDGNTGWEFGTSLALTPDDSTLVVGAPGVHQQAGAAYVLTAVNGLWSANAVLLPTGNDRRAEMGTSVAITADASSLLVGDAGFDHQRGIVERFTGGEGGWSRTQVLRPVGRAPFDTFGSALAMTPDGSQVLVGSPNHAFAGAVYAYTG